MAAVSRLSFLLSAGLVVLALALVAPAAHADDAGASAVVVHGVPGLTVDVYVNGDLALPSFEPGTVTDPIALPAGTYALAITAEGGDPDDPVLAGSATLADGDNVSIVAHLDADGGAALSIFANDLSQPAAGEGRVVVRHVAAAPAVDVAVKQRWFRWLRHIGTLEDLENGDDADADLRAGRYLAAILPAGGKKPVAPLAKLRVKRDRATIVYAVGSLEGGTFQLLVQNLALTGTTAAVSVVHGVPGLTVDVYVNGDLTLPSFEPGTITDPLALPPGTYEVAIVAEGGDPDSPAISGEATVAAGDNVSLVAHLDADGTPVLGAFVNNDAASGAVRSRFVVRHTAAAPAVDARLERCVGWRYVLWAKLRNLVNGDQKQRVVFPGYYRASVNLAGMPSAVVLGPASLSLKPRMLYVAYAVGSAADDTLDLLVQALPLR